MTTPSMETIPVGLCQCGCGGKTSIARLTNSKFGHRAGYPVRFILGHQSAQKRQHFSDAAPFKIDGDYCKLVQLTKGQFHVVDADQYERVRKITWTAHWMKTVRSFYAWNCNFGLMHRYLLGLAKGDPRTVDHIDPSRTWDNRFRNMRIADRSQQMYNTRLRRDNTSGYKGVSWCKQMKKYHAGMSKNGKWCTLGYNDDPAVCAELYRIAILEERGGFGRIG